jgi:coenzyme Q-binding protein COQ10
VKRPACQRQCPTTTGTGEYLDSPFSHLQNRSVFQPTGENACEVEFFIEYEFKSRTFVMLMGAMFDTAFRKFAAAFERRADEVYGRKSQT